MNLEKIKALCKKYRNKVIVGVLAMLLISGGAVTAMLLQGEQTNAQEVKKTEAKEEKHVHTEDCDHETEGSETKATEEEADSVDVVAEEAKEEIPSEETKPAQSTATETKSTQAAATETKPTQSVTTETKPTQSASTGSKPAVHEHNWEPVYKSVTIPAQGHYKDVIIAPARTEPIYEYQPRHICNQCGADITNDPNHIKNSLLSGGNCGSWRDELKPVQVGIKEIPAVTEPQWVETAPARTEQQISGYRCNGCGATK